MSNLTVPVSSSFRSRKPLPRTAPALVGVFAVALGLLLALIGVKWVGAAVLAVVSYLVVMTVWSGAVEGRRKAVDRLMTGLIWVAFGIVCIPLGWLIYNVVHFGLHDLNGSFLSTTMRNIGPTDVGGGVYAATIGTLLITLGAAVIAVPLGLMTAVYLVEYGRGTRMARVITLLVDVMTGIPSIVAGLFALSIWTLLFGFGTKMGITVSVALALLMTPTIVRSTEEMLRLVPDDLREASYALGVPKWRTITKVVLRTSIGGILTGVMLAVARVVGETAPILVILDPGSVNYNGSLFGGSLPTLPSFIRAQFHDISVPSPGDPAFDRMWAGALVLILIVMILNLIARFIGKIFAPKTGR